MADYSFFVDAVYDSLGGVVRVARSARITVTDPATGLTAADLKQQGQPVPWITSDGKGGAAWTSTLGVVQITAPNGLSRLIESPDYLAEVHGAPEAAQAAADSAAASATSAQNAANLVGSPAASAIDTYLLSGASVAVRKGDIVLDPKDYGAKGDGVGDDTAAWQAAVNAAPAGATIDGFGRTYLVTSIILKSNLTVRSANFKTSAGTGNGRSPITIGAASSSTVVRGIRLRGVNIDGNRSNQTGLLTTEDGACNGFRILGPVQDIIIEDCSATNCATDGLCIYSANSPLRNYSTGISSRVRVIRTKLTGNRRHGASGDSVTDLSFEDCDLSGNGLNADGTTTPGSGSDGSKGALQPGTGTLYGNGLDLEEYGPDTYAANVRLIRCTATGNALGGALFYQGSNNASVAGWTPRKGFRIEGGSYDSGKLTRADMYAIEFTSNVANKTTGVFYDDVQIMGAALDGQLVLRGVGKARLDGGRISTGAASLAGTLDNVAALRVGTTDLEGKRFDTSAATASYAVTGSTVWIPHSAFTITSGTPTVGVINGHPCWVLPDTSLSVLAARVQLPGDWSNATLTAVWASTGATGAVRMVVGTASAINGAALVSPVRAAGVSPTDGGNAVPVETVLSTGRAVSGLQTVEFLRDGGHAADTLAGTAAFLGIRLDRTK
ncbi:hypothetical protein GCM10009740_31330 [Terrabacter terrae]|uniref:Endosialidase N-terminal extension domain-containing protein n=1 Tax=Terrabacter terrae TaxID=318434 RepID=A0ABN2UGS5_9MICO